MIASSPEVHVEDFERLTGWELKPEGACRGDLCIPLRRPADKRLDLREVSAALRMPLVHDADAGLWALGPEAGPTIVSSHAPDFTLPEAQGGEFSLSSLLGTKVLIVAWAPW